MQRSASSAADFSELERIGNAAVQWVKTIIKHGAGNISTAVKASHGKSVKAFEKSKSLQNERGWRGLKRRYAIGTPELVVLRAAVPMAAEGGNCEEHADLTFYYLMTETRGLNINYACGKDHAYIIVGDPRASSDTWFVIDPWTTKGVVGPYSDYHAQAQKSWELIDQRTGTNVEELRAIFAESREALGKVDTDYSSDEEEVFEERARGAYDL